MSRTDNKFFTNEPGASLLNRFKQTLKDVQFFDVLVGYFQTSGFHQLYKNFEEIEKIRILVGLGIDKQAFEIIDDAKYQMELDFTHKESRDLFADTIVDEIDQTPDTSQVEIGIQKFIEFLVSGKIQIKVHPSQKIHAKVYISRFQEDDRDYGRVITGSSNFSYSGLEGQYEFNVELKDDPDVRFALNMFEKLWADAIDVNEDYINTVQSRTWLNDKLLPYILYLKTIYEYFKEDINLDQTYEADLPEGFMELDYQKQATLAAYKILQAYNGVFISDVVGLGKTYISALLAKQLDGGKLILCPPPLKEYWEETFRDFGVRKFKVESLGKIDQLVGTNLDKYPHIFIDEAHRFRNQKTQTYAQLAEICANKKVVLVTATPFNNDIDDILSQLKLFQIPKKSLIPGVSDLDRYFKKCKRRLKVHDKGTPEHLAELDKISSEIREDILKYVMVRRTRSEIMNFFQKDILEQGLSFPDIEPPHGLTYFLGDGLENVFDETIDLLKSFSYSRYIPLLYLKRKLTPLEAQQQKNVRAFMKILLVKRLESSFHAFKNTVGRFVNSYTRYIDMFDAGKVYISKKVNVFDYLDDDREDFLLELVEKEEAIGIDSEDFTDGYRDFLEQDSAIIRKIQELWAGVADDPKITSFIKELKNNPTLSGKKVIIFTEAGETGEYLYEKLSAEFDENEVIFIHGGGGIYLQKNIQSTTAKQMIRQNYDPMSETQDNDLRILITTDVLAEGINLHRSNIVINYDLPWNPTRVLQRVGRVNRVGTEHQTIHIYNYFPTDKAESEIGLEDNIKAKIQIFHNLLGEDAKYLTEEEEFGSFEIFGDRLFKRLQSVETYTGESEERSELEYLQIIRDIRDDLPDIFEKLKRLPKKARSGRQARHHLESDSLVTFIRKGQLKKFFIANTEEAKELPFLDAMELLRCEDGEEKLRIPKQFFDFMEANKMAFDSLVEEDADDGQDGRGRSNIVRIIQRLKTPEIRHCRQYTEEDEVFIRDVREALEEGRIPYKTTQKVRKEIETEADPLYVLRKLRKGIPGNFLIKDKSIDERRNQPREVILSVYLKEGN
jgi:superfamily II DNA/RNA helicase/HKD family nuclease